MARILASFEQFLKEHFEADGLESGDEAIVFRLEDEDGHEWGCLATSNEEAELVMFYSVMLETTPKDRIDAMQEMLTRANYDLSVGNFELDLDDGEVRFKTSVDIEGIDPVPERLYQNLVEINLMMMGRYFEGLVAVMKGEQSPLEAIEAIEGDDDDDDDDE